MLTRQYLSWVILVLGALLGVIAPLWDALPSLMRLALYIALALVGPVLVVLDSEKPCLDKRWQHLLYGAIQVATFGTLAFHLIANAMRQDNAYLDFSFVAAMMLLTYSVVLNRIPKLLYVERGSLLTHPNAKFIGFIVGLVCFVPVFVPHFLPFFVPAVLALLAYWRSQLWYCATTTLSKGQHQAIWPRLAKNEKTFDLWLHLFRYSMYFPDVHNALSMLTKEQLMHLMAFHLKTFNINISINQVQVQTMDHTATSNLSEHLKNAINEKEPRAIAFWEFFDAMDALRQIQLLDSEEAKAQSDVLELPDL